MSDGTYREAPAAPDLAADVRCLRHRRVGPAEALRHMRIVPDGCVNLIWQDGQLLVAGPDRVTQLSQPPAGAGFVGLRVHPGAAPPVLGVPAHQLADARLAATAVLGHSAAELAARLGGVASAAGAAAVLQGAVRRRGGGAPAPDRAVQHPVRRSSATGRSGATGWPTTSGSASASCTGGAAPRSATVRRASPGSFAASAASPRRAGPGRASSPRSRSGAGTPTGPAPPGRCGS